MGEWIDKTVMFIDDTGDRVTGKVIKQAGGVLTVENDRAIWEVLAADVTEVGVVAKKKVGRDELVAKVTALEKVVVGQSASIALLTALVTGKKIISPEEAMLVAMAGAETQDYEGLEAADVREWMKGWLKVVQESQPSGGG